MGNIEEIRERLARLEAAVFGKGLTINAPKFSIDDIPETDRALLERIHKAVQSPEPPKEGVE